MLLTLKYILLTLKYMLRTLFSRDTRFFSQDCSISTINRSLLKNEIQHPYNEVVDSTNAKFWFLISTYKQIGRTFVSMYIHIHTYIRLFLPVVRLQTNHTIIHKHILFLIQSMLESKHELCSRWYVCMYEYMYTNIHEETLNYKQYFGVYKCGCYRQLYKLADVSALLIVYNVKERNMKEINRKC